MAGRLINIASLLTYTSNLQASQTSIIPIGPRAVSTVDAVSGYLNVRVTAVSLQTGASFDVSLWNALVTPDNQQVLYDADSSFTLSNAVTGKNITTSNATPLPRIMGSGFNLTAGNMLAVVLKFIQGTTAGPNSVTFAVDLILRDS